MTPRERELTKYLKELSHTVADFERALDKDMQTEASNGRGARIARLANNLTLANQSVMRFGLGYSWKKINRVYGRRGE